jgi:hypothetical protein
MSQFRNYPTWLLRAIHRSGLGHRDVSLELQRRELFDPILATVDERRGPWAVAPVQGMQ